MKVYTGRGDAGNTNIIGGGTVRKTDKAVEAYGTLDELNAHVSVLLTQFTIDTDIRMQLVQIQHDLFDMGSVIADKRNTLDLPFSIEKKSMLEEWIDALDSELEPLEYFVLPGGSPAGAQCHVLRTVARRAERQIVAVQDLNFVYVTPVYQYINRLSDYFFVLSRFLSKVDGAEEQFYTNTGKVFH